MPVQRKDKDSLTQNHFVVVVLFTPGIHQTPVENMGPMKQSCASLFNGAGDGDSKLLRPQLLSRAQAGYSPMLLQLLQYACHFDSWANDPHVCDWTSSHSKINSSHCLEATSQQKSMLMYSGDLLDGHHSRSLSLLFSYVMRFWIHWHGEKL